MQRIASILGVTMILLGIAATPARGQTMPGPQRWFVNINVAGQGSTDDIQSNFAFSLYEEDATVRVIGKPEGALFDFSAGGWFLDKLGPGKTGGGLTFSRRGSTTDGALTGDLPDPIEFDRIRSVNSTLSGLEYNETWWAPQVFYGMQLSDRIFAMGHVGPAFVTVDSDIVQAVSVTEGTDGPIIDATRTRASETFTGFSVGVDVQYALARQFNMDIGAGVFLRYQGASGTLAGTELSVGGAQIGGGLRLRF
jgi:hypothetical protein